MTETITDSFCERCGTRYAFEKAGTPRRSRLGRVRVLTRGITTFVANDGLPMADAMAAARDDEERAALSRQLDAFHKTFNFCMTCRQYTCPSCWNEAAAQCLTCAPDLAREVLPPAFPDLPVDGPAFERVDEAQVLQDAAPAETAWPSIDLDRAVAEPPPVEAVVAPPELIRAEPPPPPEPIPTEPPTPPEPTRAEPPPAGAAVAPPEPIAPEPSAPEAAVSPGAEAAPVVARDEPAAAEPAAAEPAAAGAPAHQAVAQASVDAGSLADAGPATELTAAELAEIEGALAIVRTEPEAGAEVEAGPWAAPAAEAGAEAVAATAAPEPATLSAPTEQAATARDQTRSLLRRFRPGRGAPAAAAAAAASAAPEAASAAPEAASVPPEARPAPLAAPDRIPAAPPVQPAPAAAPAAADAPAAAAPAVGDGVAAPDRPRADVVEQPTWQMVAPDVPAPGTPESGDAAPAGPSAGWSAPPAWPPASAAPGRTPGSDASPWAARLAASRPDAGGVWAASSREVLGGPGGSGAAPAVQACVSCGLSLSANARFCRRCGSRQG